MDRKRFVYDDTWHTSKLTADGCCARHDNKDRMIEVNMKVVPESRIEEMSERDTIKAVMILDSKGIKDLKPCESLENFVMRHSDELEGV